MLNSPPTITRAHLYPVARGAAGHRLVALRVVGTGFAAGGDIFRSGALQNILPLLGPLRTIGMHGEKNSAFFNAAFITRGDVLRNSHTNQGSRHPADRAAYTHSRQGCHDRPGSDKGTKAGNGQKAQSGKQAGAAADHTTDAGTGPRCGHLMDVGVFFADILVGDKADVAGGYLSLLPILPFPRSTLFISPLSPFLFI